MFQDAYLNFHLVMIRHFIQMGYQIVLTGFCVPQGDGIIIQKLYQALDPSQRDSVRCVLYDKNLSSILQEFKESEYVIGTRFHSIILGLICQCRVFPVIYDQKTANTLETLRFPSHFHLTELNGISSEDLQKGWIRLDPPKSRDSAGKLKNNFNGRISCFGIMPQIRIKIPWLPVFTAGARGTLSENIRIYYVTDYISRQNA